MSTMALEELVDRYCEVWSQPDESLRASGLRAIATESVVFADDVKETVGIDGLLNYMREMRGERPSVRMRRLDKPTVDKDGAVRFAWRLGNADGFAFVDGYGIAKLCTDSLLQQVKHCFGALQE